MADTPEILAQFASALGVDAASATPEAVLAALNTRLGDAAKVTTERDAVVAEVAKIKADANAAKVDAAITTALGKSGMIQANTPDAMNLLRPLFHVDDKGNVTTRGGDTGEAPGADPSQFIVARLGSLRPHWFEKSVGGGAKGGGYSAHTGPDVACFRGGTLTEQYAVVARVGEKAVIDSLRRAGIVPPVWLTYGGAR